MVGADSDVIDTHQFRHLCHAFGVGDDIGKISGYRPDTDDAARSGNGPRMIGQDTARPRRRPAGQRGMRQNQRRGRDLSGLAHQLECAMRHVDHDAELVAATDHVDAKLRQPAMYRRLRLDVTALVRTVVRELEVTQCPALMGLVEPLDPAFEKIGALRRDDERGPTRQGGAQIGRCANDRQALLASERVDVGEGASGVVVKFARPRSARGPQAAVGERDDRRVGDDGEVDRRHATLAHRSGNVGERAAAEASRDDVAGVAVEVDCRTVHLGHRRNRQAEERTRRH
jgi:hypothetical protein